MRDIVAVELTRAREHNAMAINPEHPNSFSEIETAIADVDFAVLATGRILLDDRTCKPIRHLRSERWPEP